MERCCICNQDIEDEVYEIESNVSELGIYILCEKCYQVMSMSVYTDEQLMSGAIA